MHDYIPNTDADFNSRQSNFLSALGARVTALGFPAPELAALDAARNEWETSLAAHHAARAAAATATRAKNKAPAPSSAPLARVDTGQRLRHLIRFSDQASPRRRARPAGVTGCEIWVKVGDPPSGPSDLRFVALATTSPYLAVYPADDANRPAHYLLRWVNARGERGPWSPTVSATITA